MKINEITLKKAQLDTMWKTSNHVLYQMCKDHKGHDNVEVIASKLLLIGRTYAATIERGRSNGKYGKVKMNDIFYQKVAEDLLKNLKMQNIFNDLETVTTIEGNIDKILRAHHEFTEFLRKVTGKGKRSLASKYLHFHFPHLFYIYDEFASKGLNKLRKEKILNSNPEKRYDEVYSRFFQKCHDLVNTIKRDYADTDLDPRKLDNLLLQDQRP